MKKKINFINIFIVLFLVISIFYPLSMMISKVSFSDFTTLITSIPFRRALFNSLSVTLISTLISILIAYILAYTINRCNIKYKNILKILITIPMLIVSISHGIGLINLFGASGIISRLFDFNIVGEVGIIIGSIMYSFPVAFIMIDDSFKYIDSSMYDNAKVLGLSKFETFKSVTLCYLKKPLLSSIFAIFTLIFTDYGVPLAVGGKFITLPVYLYKEVLGLLDYSKGTMIGMFLIVPAIISFIIDNVIKDRNDNSSTSNYIVTKNNVRDIVCKVFTFIIILFVGMILGSFIYYAFINNPVLDNSLSLNHFSYVIDSGIFKYIINSIIIALFVSLFGTIISYLGAYSTSRMKMKYKKNSTFTYDIFSCYTWYSTWTIL